MYCMALFDFFFFKFDVFGRNFRILGPVIFVAVLLYFVVVSLGGLAFLS